MKKGFLIFASLFVLFSCTKTPKVAKERMVEALPHVIVYRMNGDYAHLVPVTLDETGTHLVSYPDPHDIFPSAMPEYLADGWYLDHRGISKYTVFTSYTYDEYQNLKECPTQEELLNSIIVTNGITEIKDLGTKPLTKAQILKILGYKPTSEAEEGVAE